MNILTRIQDILPILLTIVFLNTASAFSFDPVTQDLHSIDKDSPPAFHEVFIPVAEVNLTGFVLTANGQGPHPTAVLLHGLPGNEKNLDIAQSLRRAGFNILFFHYRGSWGSEGDYSFLTLHEDAQAALNFLRKHADKYHVDINKLSIIGHSFGGYTALRTGATDKNLTCVVGLSAANPAMIANSDRVKNDFNKSIGAYIDKLFMLNNFPGKQAIAELVNNAKKMDTRSYGEGLKGKKVLLVVGSEDTVTPASLQKDVVSHYKKIKGLALESHIIAGDHAYSISRIKLQRLVTAWMGENCK